MDFEPVLFVWPPLRLAWIELRARIGLCRCPAASPAGCLPCVEVKHVVGEMGRSRDRSGCSPGLLCGRDLRGREWCAQPGGCRAHLKDCRPWRRASGLDRVALEVTGSWWEVERILEPTLPAWSWSARMTPGSRGTREDCSDRSGSRAASGSPTWSSRWKNESQWTPGSATLTSLTARSPRSSRGDRTGMVHHAEFQRVASAE